MHALGIREPTEILPGLAQLELAPAAMAKSFSYRFRDADADAWFYEMVLVGDPCSYCGMTAAESGARMQVDHVDSILNGGEGDWWNLTAACRRCNSSKCDAPSFLLWLLQSPRIRLLRDQMTLDIAA